MKFAIFSLLLASLGAVLATDPQTSVIISFPDDAPPEAMTQAMNAITSAGGIITHQYVLFKGFAATAPQAALDAVKTMDEKYKPVVDVDQIVSANGGNP